MAERSGLVKNGLSQTVRFEPPGYMRRTGPHCSSVSIAVMGARNSSWRVRVYAEIDGEIACLGAVKTLPGGGGVRVVAIASCPGASAWEVRADRVTAPRGYDTEEELVLRLAASDVGGVPGVSPVHGQSTAARLDVVASGVDGSVSITGAVVGWSASAGPVAATVSVDGSMVTVPPYGIVSGEAIAERPWPTEFVFTGTVAYLITYERSQLGGAV